MGVNLVKGKKQSNIRTTSADEALKIFPKTVFSLEECMEYIRDDEYLEVTPLSLRMRKSITVNKIKKTRKIEFTGFFM
jgi:GTP-binding protein